MQPTETPQAAATERRQRYEAMKKQPLHLPNLDALIENFDQALSHPDAEDLERLKQAAVRL